CGHRLAIWAGSILLPYAAYNSTDDKRTSTATRWGRVRGDHPVRYAPEWEDVRQPQASIVILGGGPGGYEAALVAAQLGARVTVVDSDGLGGACVLTDCVPSKTLIATSETMGLLHGSPGLGIRIPGAMDAGADWVDAPRLYGRVRRWPRRSRMTSRPGWRPRASRSSGAGDGSAGPAQRPGPMRSPSATRRSARTWC